MAAFFIGTGQISPSYDNRRWCGPEPIIAEARNSPADSGGIEELNHASVSDGRQGV